MTVASEIRKLAYRYYNAALHEGTLIRQPCEKCGVTKGVDGHHDDYSKPLQIRWLCKTHHIEWHKYNKPVYGNGMTESGPAMFLSEQEVIELTGKERCDAQARVLDSMKVIYKTREDGSVVILRSYIEAVFNGRESA